MKRDLIVKKAIHKIRANEIKIEFLDYLKENPSDIFDQGDVKLRGRLEYNKHVEEYSTDRVEIESARIVGMSDLLQDLYEGTAPEKEEIQKDASKIYTEFNGKTFPFKTTLDDQDVSGEIKIIETRYCVTRDEIEVTEFELEDVQVG